MSPVIVWRLALNCVSCSIGVEKLRASDWKAISPPMVSTPSSTR